MNRDSQQKRLGLLLPFIVLALVCCLIISLTALFTRERIERNKQEVIINIIEALMPLPHDNELYDDTLAVPALSTTVYRARQGEQLIGLVFLPVYARGYNGNIELAMGISYDGILSGVRVIEHQETEGLGDGIDQSKTDWILNFDNRSLTGNANITWAVSSDGGDFDQLSGATISPRAVINAVKDTLEFYQINRDDLYK